MLTETEIRVVVRDECERIDREKQAICPHTRSATMREGVPYCDVCGAEVVFDGS